MIIIVLFILIWACIDVLSLGAKYHKLPNKKVLTLILAIYIFFVLYVTLLNRTMAKDIDYNLELFWSYKNMLMVPGMSYFKEIVLNIVLFVPFGFLPIILFEKLNSIKVIVPLAFMFSLYIELSQLVLKIGLFEYDDLFDNTLGALIGYGIFFSLNSLISNSKNQITRFVLGLIPFFIVSAFFIAIFFVKTTNP